MSENYYDREHGVSPDGLPLFANETDRKNEDEVAALIESSWSCKLRRFGYFSPVDFWALRDGLMVGLVEIKARTHSTVTYDTVFLNVRKYLALTLAQVALGVRATFVVKFTDGVRVIAVDEVDARRHVIAGCSRRVKSYTDREPVIEVPVSAMTALAPVRSTSA